ncbi:hypothetical protein [Paenibacillus kobensis]|uniref:hypothetical protein n=1 Tax=Paenibacillus kobensis TaxID=59841 RepID=UPI000FD868CF|nr:hypothetical protein [Paenibacillus kobensis]
MNPLEKKLVKTGIYTFIIGLLIGLLLVKDEYRTAHDVGTYLTVGKPWKQYVLELLRFAAKISLVSLAVITVKHFVEPMQRDDTFSFFKGFVQAFVAVLLLMVAAVPILMWLTGSF